MFLFLLAAGTLAAILLAFQRVALAALSVFVLCGALYFTWFHEQARVVTIPFGERGTVSGVIVSAAHGLDRQEAVIRLSPPQRGRIRITTNPVPRLNYGDEVSLTGVIRARETPGGRDLREHIAGTMRFPNIEVTGVGRGSPRLASLFRVKSFAVDAFARVLAPERASFLAGLTLGETAGFSDEFRESLRKTGTSHLVALSGYNITIIAKTAVALAAFFFARRAAFVAATLAIFAFVLMTGAEASVVRAGIMGFLVLLADQVGRLYSFRNALAVAAFLMVLVNPYVLQFDVGFQLSFAAVVGLVYVRPALMDILRVSRAPGFLGWRENLWTTIAAQLAVLPILLGVFGSFSPLSVVVNLLVLLLVPITMAIGFSIVGLSVISSVLALPLGWLASVFLNYELGVIHFFARVGGETVPSSFGIPFALFYYGALAAFLAYARTRKPYAAASA